MRHLNFEASYSQEFEYRGFPQTEHGVNKLKNQFLYYHTYVTIHFATTYPCVNLLLDNITSILILHCCKVKSNSIIP